MYRILSASKDTYITNKIISRQRVTGSNVGQAGTMDLFKLYNESSLSGSTTGSIIELSRALIRFDYSELEALTGSILNFASGNFAAYVSLKDVYGGQTTPSNFTLELFPLSKSFDEGRGFDVVAFRDLDSANWLTASQSPVVTWSQAGAGATGSLGEDVDIIISGTLGTPTVVGFGTQQTFTRGDENLLMDVTQLVSASLAGLLPNNGFRISYSSSEEQDTVTRFVKRFGTTNAFNKTLHPKLIVKYNDNIADQTGYLNFNTTQNIFLYNIINGNHTNLFSGSVELTGSNILSLELVASKSILASTTSYSPSHSASITYMSRSTIFMSRSFTGSQFDLNGLFQTGIYYTPVSLSLHTDTEISNFVGNNNNFEFKAIWKDINTVVSYSQDFLTFDKITGNFSNIANNNFIFNITNLKQIYHKNETARLKVFVSDLNKTYKIYKLPTDLPSTILPNIQWQLRNAYTRDIIIPFDETTKLSTSKNEMYFDFYFTDLDINQVYEFEFLIKNDTIKNIVITNNGFRFKVVK